MKSEAPDNSIIIQKESVDFNDNQPLHENEKTDIENSISLDKEHKLGIFEKYLALWVALCMGIGILLSQFVPIIGNTLESWQVQDINIPIGICLFFMMYPALLNLQFSEIKKLGKNPLPILLTLISNWILAPLVAAGLGYLFLRSFDP